MTDSRAHTRPLAFKRPNLGVQINAGLPQTKSRKIFQQKFFNSIFFRIIAKARGIKSDTRVSRVLGPGRLGACVPNSSTLTRTTLVMKSMQREFAYSPGLLLGARLARSPCGSSNYCDLRDIKDLSFTRPSVSFERGR